MRFAFFSLLSLSLLFASCEDCKRCSYTHEVTTIVQTVNGEVEQTTTLQGVLSDAEGATFGEECIKSNKGESFTIEQFYQDKKDTTVLNNFQFTCDNL